MGDSDPELAGRANRFFVRWRELIRDLLERARQAGRLRPEADCAALAGLMVSALEGALLICKAAQDGAQLRETASTLLGLVAAQEIGAPLTRESSGVTTRADLQGRAPTRQEPVEALAPTDS